MSDLAWAGAFFVPAMTAVLGLLGPARRALTRWGESFGLSDAEREAKAALDLAEAQAKRHDLAVRGGAIGSEVEMEKARLAAETAQFETGAKAARECLPAAVEARQVALRARAEAEAALAPEAARTALEASGGHDMARLSEAYAAYCSACLGTPWSFGQWANGFNGLRK